MRAAPRAALIAAAAALTALLIWSRGVEERSPRRLDIELAGCTALLAGGTCAIAPAATSTLTLWIAGEGSGRIDVALRGEPLAAEIAELPGGRRLTVHARSEGELSARANDAVWTARLVVETHAAELAAARGLRARGRLDDAIDRARRTLASRPGPAEESEALGLIARIELQRSQVAEARASFEAALEADLRAARRSSEARDALALAYLCTTRLSDFPAARAAIARALQASRDYPEGRANAEYQLGLLSQETGDYPGAIRHHAEAEQRADRLALTSLVLDAREQRAAALQSTGRMAEARALFASLRRELPPGADPCRRARLLTNEGNAHLRESIERGTTSTAAEALLREALSELGACSPDRGGEAIVRINLAFAAVHRGALAIAAEQQAALGALGSELDPRLAPWSIELRGAFALAEGRFEVALREHERLRDTARILLLPDAEWRAEVGRGRALEGLGRTAGAADAYRAAERVADRHGMSLALGAGRGTFLGERAESARRLVDLLFRSGDVEGACTEARWARVRAIRRLARRDAAGGGAPEAEARWDRAVAEYHARRRAIEAAAPDPWALAESQRQDLIERRREAAESLEDVLRAAVEDPALGPDGSDGARRPIEGTLLLLFFPMDRGWLGCAINAGGVIARHLDRVERGSEAAVLGAFRAELLHAKRVAILAYGTARELDLHAASLDGRVLSDILPVEYALDLGEEPSLRSDDASARRATVVADPSGDLPLARREGAQVEHALASADPKWSVRALAGAAARAPDVRAAIEASRLFHYAGHGDFAGLGGWQSELPLARSDRLAVADILTLAHVPELVVLSGCDTGRADRSAEVETLGLAQAFLLAGARAVIAAVRPVEEPLAEAIARALYAEGPDALERDPAAALARAAQRVHELSPKLDAAAFRTFVR